MATVQEINHLYATQLGSVPTQADYDAWAGYSGDQLYNSFTSAAQSDPRYGTTYNPASVGIDGGFNGTVGENTWVNGVMNGGTAGTGATWPRGCGTNRARFYRCEHCHGQCH